MKRDYLHWDIKADGIYLTVSPEMRGKIEVNEVIAELQNEGVMNLDGKRMLDILMRASGRPEFLGPPFQKFDSRKLEYLQFELKPASLRLLIQPAFRETKLPLTPKDIEFILNLKKVVVGADWDLITRLTKKIIYGEWFLIASAIPPEDGKNGRIDEIVKVDFNAKPLHVGNGMVDFKTIENIHQVEENTLIAIRIPPTLGKQGTDIFGNPIYPRPGEDVHLQAGSFMRINSEKTEMRSSCAGYLYREESGHIAVGRLFLVPGDVNYKIGNIKYSGDVLVQGNVLTDFEIEADGDITIQGSVEGAKISSKNGKVTIRDGIFGKNKAVISAALCIDVSIAQNADLRVEKGDLVFSKQLLNCKIRSQSVLPKQRNTIINGCDILCYEKVICTQLGTPNGNKTKIKFLNAEFEMMQKLFSDVSSAYNQMTSQVSQLEERLRTMKAILKKSSEVSERSMDELKKVLAQYQAAQKNQEVLALKRNQIALMQKQNQNMPGLVQFETLSAGLIVTIADIDYEVRSGVANTAICWQEGGFKSLPAEPIDKYLVPDKIPEKEEEIYEL
jgi:uncharacterized protein (DUF342 family)